jgi:hypothetical protein
MRIAKTNTAINLAATRQRDARHNVANQQLVRVAGNRRQSMVKRLLYGWSGVVDSKSASMKDEFDFDFEAVKHNERDDDYNLKPSMKMAMTCDSLSGS